MTPVSILQTVTPGANNLALRIAGPCRRAGAGEDLIPGWIEEGRRRSEAARHLPFSGGVRPLVRPAYHEDHGSVTAVNQREYRCVL
jgi:hypothetical protein